MTTEEILKSKGLYEVNDIRYLKFYMHYIFNEYRNRKHLKISKESQNKKELQGKIVTVFNNANYDLESHVQDMNKQALENFLPEKSFYWIDKNEDRINYFVWSILRMMTCYKDELKRFMVGYRLKPDECVENLTNSERNPYYSSELNLMPLNKIEARELFLDFFDQWDGKASAKENLMRKIKSEWISLTNVIDPDYSWIEEKNKKQNIWIYEYIKSKKYLLPILPKPTSTAQYYNTNIALLDSFFTLNQGHFIDISNKQDTT